MEFILAIGSAIVGKVASVLGRQVEYVIYCKRYLQKIEEQMEELNAVQQRLANEVSEVKTRGEIVLPEVHLWLKNVDEINAATYELLEYENQAKLNCLHGSCPNLILRHRLGRKSKKLVRHIDEIYQGRGFSRVSGGWDVSTGEFLAFPSRTSILKQIMDELKNPNTHRIGVYGIRGVGKTTLVQEVYRQATEDKKLFDDVDLVVILLDVKENLHLEGIQNKIFRMLNMETFDNGNSDGRANRPSASIQDKNILVILDNVWEQIDLEALELPSVATCKMLLTSRSRKSLSGMSTQKVFQLDILPEEEAWVLFEKKAGDVVMRPAIQAVATQVAKCCSGLPILVVIVASALKKQTVLPPWEDALRNLRKSDSQGLTEKAYLCLEWSYDQLKDKELEQLFLLCGFAIWGKDIYLPALLKYSMGLGLFRKGYTMEQAEFALHTMVDKLKDSCLLTDGDDSRYVRMHELVRNVANRIELRDKRILSSVEDGGDYELKEWLDKDFLKKCTTKSLQSSTVPVLSEVPRIYPKLKLFYLHGTGDISVEIPTNFFREFEELEVLDLTGLHMLSLPSLQFLRNLRALFLDQCIVGDVALVGQLSNLEILSFFRSNVKQLPKEIGKLTHLRLLDLSDCSELEVISPGVISSLERLQELRMRNSFNKWEVEGERSNASLIELKHLSQLSVLEIHILNADILPANLFSHKFERFNIFIGDAWVDSHTSGEKFMAETTLNTLKLKLTTSVEKLDKGLIWLLKRCEDLSLSVTEGAKNIEAHNLDADFTHLSEQIGLPNLTRLAVHRCNGLSFLLSSSMAKVFVQLKHLRISKCQIMKEIILTEGHSEENKDNLFPKLEQLELNDLPCLTRFCSASYVVEFAALERLQLEKCTKLETFIFNHSSDRIPIDKIKGRDTNDENVETVAPYFLFNEKVGLPRLERLTINDLPRLTRIWHTQLDPDSFCRLRDVTVQQCNSLRNIVPDSIIARVFQQLEKLTVEFSLDIWYSRPSPAVFCLKAVLPGISSRQTDGFLPQSLKTLRLHGMEIKLMRLLEENPVFPLLEILEVKFCGLNNLELSAISFRNLTIIEVTFCWRLQYLTTYLVAQSLVGLKKLKVDECKNMKEIFTSEGIEEDASNCEIVFSRLQHLELSDLVSLEQFCSRNCIVKVPSLENSALQVNWCPFQLKISTDGVLEQVVSYMHQDVQNSHTGREEVLDTNESACSLEINVSDIPNTSEVAQDIEFNAGELHNDRGEEVLDTTESAGSLETNQKQHVPNTFEVAQDIEFNAGELHNDRGEKFLDTTESACNLETNKKQHVPNTSEVAQDIEFNAGELHDDRLGNNDGPLLPGNIAESEHGVEAVIQETPINLRNLEHVEVINRNQKQIVTNTLKNLQEADFGVEESLNEPLNANEGRPLQLKQLYEVQTDSLPQSISKLDGEIKRLQDELRAKEADRRDKQQRLADERLATVDRLSDSLPTRDLRQLIDCLTLQEADYLDRSAKLRFSKRQQSQMLM